MFFDSNSSNTNLTQTETHSNSHNTDASIQSNGSTYAGYGNRVNVLDGGAIADAFKFASAASSDTNKTLGSAFNSLIGSQSSGLRDLVGAQSSGLRDLVGAQANSLAGMLSGVQSTQNFIASTQAQATGQMDNRTKMFIALGALAVIGLMFWSNKK